MKKKTQKSGIAQVMDCLQLPAIFLSWKENFVIKIVYGEYYDGFKLLKNSSAEHALPILLPMSSSTPTSLLTLEPK